MNKPLLVAIAALFLGGCAAPRSEPTIATARVSGPMAPAAPHSKRFQMLLAAAQGGTLEERFPETDEEEVSIAADQLPRGVSAADVFKGTYRASAKTSFASGPAQSFADTRELIATLPDDEAMRSNFAHLISDSDGVDEPRENVEDKNVTMRAWIYWAKKESDRDFHVVVGNTPIPQDDTVLMNTEVSGLPRDDPEQKDITATRVVLKDLISKHHPKKGLFEEPIHVQISGSLFWDGEHSVKHVGPDGLQPDTAWEIHPIKKLKVLTQ